MHIFLGLVGAIVGGLSFTGIGVLYGAFIGLLTAEILSLRTKVGILERAFALEREKAKEAAEEAVEPAVEDLDSQPFTSEPPLSEPVMAMEEEPALDILLKQEPILEPEPSPNHFLSSTNIVGDRISEFFVKIGHFFTRGNLVLKIGIMILFIGVAFLLKYAAQRNMIPVEFRLIGVVIGGMVMVGTGWRLRRTKLGYGLILQGGGVGILYLVVFAAAKLYHFLPIPLCLGVMVGLVVFSCMLAVLQEAKSLAIFSIVGGFIAPILMSTGGGSHVMLFSYYALLNAGILGIAWFKSWRELNLIGFFFTFGIGTLWGSTGYQPEHFWTTEPFLLLFFVFYAFISILFAHRQPINLRGYIDGPLVFGLPLVVSGLQYYLVRKFPYGMAFSALGLGLFYLTAATLLWRRLTGSMHMICEAFLALGVVFGSLAIPLALSGHWSASIWALEGAGMIWVGVRQERVLARLFGLLLQLGAAGLFVHSAWYSNTDLPFANSIFLGCTFLSVAALFSSYSLEKCEDMLKVWEKHFPLPLLIWGLIWWYIGGIREMDKLFYFKEAANGFLLFCSVSSVIKWAVAEGLQWSTLRHALLLHLPAMIIIAMVQLLGYQGPPHLFAHWGAAAWIVAFIILYRILYLLTEEWPKFVQIAWHIGSLWLLFFVVSHEAVWAAGQVTGLSEVWTMICWALIPICGLLLLLRLSHGVSWPVGRYSRYYLWIGSILPIVSLVLWLIFSFSMAGNPLPLPYVPLFNPMELTEILVMVILILWGVNRKNSDASCTYLPVKESLWGAGILFFIWFNSVVARIVHFYVGIPYLPRSLYHSVVFQTAIAAIWGLGALGITVWAARKGSRPVWKVGALLLGITVLKLFIVDLSGTGTIARIVSFLVVGVLMLIIGYFSPLPPQKEESNK
jgi:uncharacterized membrane protein